MNNGKLLLTSTGLSSEPVLTVFRKAIVGGKKQPVAIITTASEGKEKNKYSILAKNQLHELGFDVVDFVDLETEPSRDLSSYGLIYVCGGNTFKLLKYAKEADFKNTVNNLLERGGTYVGVSAGSIIVGPSIRIANEVEPDPNDIGLEDLSGLGVVDSIVYPHYTIAIEGEVKDFEKKYNVVVDRINDSQAILIGGGEKVLVQ